MTNAEKLNFKQLLKQFCQSQIEQRITAARLAIDNAQQAANNEEKSSAGDKYETSRAMSHLEKDMHSRQLASYLKELSALHEVAIDKLYTSACTGAFIECEEKYFFIAAGIGKQQVADKTIFFLSPHAPLTTAVSGKKAGEAFEFNGNSATILTIF